MCHQDYVIGKDEVGEVLTVYLYFFLLPVDLINDDVLEGG